MPVVFGVQLDPATVEPSDFEIVSESGSRFTPSCATLRPALGDDERRTVLLTGPLGSASDPPAFVQVTGELAATDVRGVQWGVVRGIRSPPVRRVEEGPRIELAIVWASADLDVCADGNLRIQTTWSGGITGPLGREFDARDLGSFAVEIEPVSSGDSREVSPASFGDLGDGDNHLDLCIGGGYRKHLAGEEGSNGEDPIVRLNRRMTAELAAPEGERHPADLWIQKAHPWEAVNKGA